MTHCGRCLCEHERTITVHGKVNESVSFQWPDEEWSDSYFGDVGGLIDGDYIEVKVCIDCKTVLGMPSADEILAMRPETFTPHAPKNLITNASMEEADAEAAHICEVCGYPREQGLCEACKAG